MSNGVVKLRKCSDPNETIWVTGEPGNWGLGLYSITTIGKVVKLSNYSGPAAGTTTNFAPSPSDAKLGIGASTYILNPEDCWQCVQVEIAQDYDDPTDPDGPWITDGGIVVNGFSQLAGYNTCNGCIGEDSTDDDCPETTSQPCGKNTSTGCQNKDCGCQDTPDVCLAAPPDCGDECSDCDCEEVMPSQCVVYNGPKIECLGINPGMSMNQVVALIGSNLCNADIETTCSDLECSNNPVPCSSPLDLIFKPFFEEIAENDFTNPADVEGLIDQYFGNIWRNGIIRSNDCTDPVCCQECCDDKFYFLGAAQLGFLLFELTEYPSCCANSSFDASIATATSILNEAVSSTTNELINIWSTKFTKDVTPPNAMSVALGLGVNPLIFGNTKQCCTDGSFQECLQELYDAIDQDQDIVNAGIVESQYANNESLVCEIEEYLTDQSIYTLTLELRTQILEYFLYRGFVVSCCNSQIFIGGAETFYELITEGTISSCIPDKVAPTFDFGPYCLDSTNPMPPAVSLEGITGSWVETSLDTSTAGDDGFLTFIPDSGQNAYSVEVFYEVVEVVPNDLNLIACADTAGSGIATIDLTLEEPNIYAGAGNTYEWFADPTLVTPTLQVQLYLRHLKE
jgi:hypothetical protein